MDSEKKTTGLKKEMLYFWLGKNKVYIWYFFGVMGIVFFWAGVWDGIGGLSYLQNPWISLLVGLIMLLVSKTISKDAFVKKNKADVGPVLNKVHHHPQKHEFNIKYSDKFKNKDITIKASKVKKIEKEFLVLLDKGKESFIPFHRITEVKHKNKIHWKS